METWARAANFTLCGLCGDHIRIGAPILRIKLPGVTRLRIRGECCAGAAPPDLPELMVPGNRTAKMTPLKKTAAVSRPRIFALQGQRMSFRYAAKIDSTHKAIVDYLRERGCSVYAIGRPVDLLIGYRTITVVAELKTPKGKFKAAQVKFFQEWAGGPAVVLETVEDAEQLLRWEWHKLEPTPEALRRIRD